MSDLDTVVPFRSVVTQHFREGAEKIFIASSVELLGKLVHAAQVGGKLMITLVDPKRPLTIQCGKNSTINVYAVTNNELSVTPISVQHAGAEGDVVFYGSGKVPTAIDNGRVDFERLKYEVETIESMRLFQNNDQTRIQGTSQQEAINVMNSADEIFFEGVKAESFFNTDRMFYCPLFDCNAETDYNSRKFYTEALRKFNECVALDMTNYSFYSKRAATLCKLKMFDRGLADAETYCNMRPQSPSGYCLKGVCFHGMGELSLAIKEFEKGVEINSVAYYDSSRVWSTGTLIQDVLDFTIEKREKLSDTAKVSNKQGLTWLDRGEFGQAIPKLYEAVKFTAQSLGKEHISYAITVNNLAACQEAMGNYDEALKNYQMALQLTEVACAGELQFFLISGRHMPHGCKNGVWEAGTWIPGAMTCNPYVKVELYEKGIVTLVQESKIQQNSYQPKWDYMMKMHAQNADCDIVFSLISASSEKQALESVKLENIQLIESLVKDISLKDAHIRFLQMRTKDIEAEHEITKKKLRSKGAPTAEVSEQVKLEIFKLEREVEATEDEIQALKLRITNLDESCKKLDEQIKSTEEKLIGKCSYSVRKLANTLHGKQYVADKQWFTVIDENGRKIRGEDFGVTALQIEVIWTPEDVEYASRLCNVGNLYRILGDTFSSRAGGGNDLKKLETYYVLSEQYLDNALKAMKDAKSKVRHEESGILALAASDPKKVTYVDGTKTLEYLIILENLAVLHKSKGMIQNFPKGTPESTMVTMQAIWSKSQRRAVDLLQEALRLRQTLSGESSPECILLLLHLVTVYWAMGSFREAFSIQEQITKLVKSEEQKRAHDWTRQLGVLNELHLMLGDTRVEASADGSWCINTTESWHWDMVAILSRKVKTVCRSQAEATSTLEVELEAVTKSIDVEKVQRYNPPPITEFKRLTANDTLAIKVREAAPDSADNQRPMESKVARAVASKLKKPETHLTSMDSQAWPNNMFHTKGS